MKTTLILIVFFAMTFAAVAQDGDYRSTLKRAHDRLNHLETERHDYRKPKPELPPDLEKERLQLIGQLTEDDPLWVLSRDLEADVVALAAARDRSEADSVVLDRLKDLLAVISGATEAPTSREQAAEFATVLRTFILRRDVSGASDWIKQHTK